MLLRILISRGVAFILLGGIGLWAYQKPQLESAVADFLSEPDFDYFPEVQKLMEEEDFGTALSLIAFIRTTDDVANQDKIIQTEEKAQKELKSVFRRAEEVFLGAFTGKVDTPEAFGGAFVADFFVVGDLRDLVIQGSNKLKGEETDSLVVLLSSAGVVTTIAGFLPEPTTTAAGFSGQACLSMLKGMRKAGIMTDKFADELTVVIKAARESGEIKGFKNLYSNFKSLKAHAPPGTMSSILRKVKSSDDLALVAKTMEHFPDETVTLFRVGGDDAMNFLRAIDDTQPRQLRMILRKGPLKFQKAKLALRGSKAVANGRLPQGRDLLASWLMAHPDIRRFVLVISSFLLGLGLWLLLRPFLHRNRKQTEEGTRPQQSETASI